MPYKIRKLPGRDTYRVTSEKSGTIKARETTLQRARAQVRLLHALNNPKFKKKTSV